MTEAVHNKRLVIWILGALSTVTPFAIDLYLPAFTQIATDFGSTASKVSLSVTSYFIGMALGQILYGPLLDRYGRKKPLYVGLVLFIGASIGCMFSNNIDMLVTVRFIQALGGCVAWTAALTLARDFFPVKESARIFSLLILIIGVSPLLAPTIGGFIVSTLGWQWVFVALILLVVAILAVTFFYLPDGLAADPTISLRPGPMLATFTSILKHPQFYTYALAGSFSFATLFVYVAGSPVIFMEVFQVSPQMYGAIFALLSVGFIGGSQVNIYLVRTYKSESIFRWALTCQIITSLLFLISSYNGWLGLSGVIVCFFILMSCIGLINPNATAISLAPFDKNIGSASSLIAFLQLGIAALASGSVGLFNNTSMVSIIAVLTVTSGIAFIILATGRKKIGKAILAAENIPGNVVH